MAKDTLNEERSSQESQDSQKSQDSQVLQESQKSEILLVPTKVLIVVAGVVWMAAGAAVFIVGLRASTAAWTVWMAIAALITFAFFVVMFLMISRRNIQRILGISDKLSFLFSFFNIRSYAIMVIMIFLGAAVRLSTFVPNWIIAFFYSGLGAALAFAGIYYMVSYIKIWKARHFFS